MITKRIESLPLSAWIRTCDACGHMQQDREPDRCKELSNAYCNRKCRKCGSEALDYGCSNGSEDWTEESE